METKIQTSFKPEFKPMLKRMGRRVGEDWGGNGVKFQGGSKLVIVFYNPYKLNNVRGTRKTKE